MLIHTAFHLLSLLLWMGGVFFLQLYDTLFFFKLGDRWDGYLAYISGFYALFKTLLLHLSARFLYIYFSVFTMASFLTTPFAANSTIRRFLQMVCFGLVGMGWKGGGSFCVASPASRPSPDAMSWTRLTRSHYLNSTSNDKTAEIWLLRSKPYFFFSLRASLLATIGS